MKALAQICDRGLTVGDEFLLQKRGYKAFRCQMLHLSNVAPAVPADKNFSGEGRQWVIKCNFNNLLEDPAREDFL